MLVLSPIIKESGLKRSSSLRRLRVWSSSSADVGVITNHQRTSTTSCINLPIIGKYFHNSADGVITNHQRE